jgi:AraC-like DNA-binding protein
MNYADRVELNDMSLLIPDNEPLSEEISVNENFTSMVYRNQENNNFHNSYEREQILMSCIENGDLAGLEEYWKTEVYVASYGVMGKNPLRSAKNLCIAVITLASRAAIKGGVHPEVAFSLCDCYVLKIEECPDTKRCGQLTLRAERNFTGLVASAKIKYHTPEATVESPHITHCKNHIMKHLHEKLTVKGIAEALFLNPNYLNDLFRKHEGITVLQYIIQEKIKLAQNMLMYSNRDYNDIATSLGFSSHSHMNMHFKKFTGLTIGKYRAKYQAE